MKKITHRNEIKGLLVQHYLGTKVKKAENPDWFKEYQNDFSVMINNEGTPVIKLDSVTFVVYNKSYECWAYLPESVLLKSFDLDDPQNWKQAKPVLREFAFEFMTQDLLRGHSVKDTSLAGQGEFHKYLAKFEETGAASNVIARVEEEMLYCMESLNRKQYEEALKNYIIELVNQKMFEKLKYFLLITLLSDQSSKERAFLKRLGVNPETIVSNSLKILNVIDFCKGLVDEIKQGLELSLLEKL